MRQRIKRYAMWCSGFMATCGLAACGNLSKIDDQGQAESPVWPDASRASLKDGTYLDLRHLSMVKPGMTKDQLYDLLGRPHFQEGLFMVREWDYLFHLRTSSGDLLCQYKVLFDRNGLVGHVYWRTQLCSIAARQSAGNEEDGTPR